MSLAGKIVITILACLVLAVAALVGLGALLWSWHGNDLRRAGQQQFEQGKAYGTDTDEAGCLAAALERYKGRRGLTSSLAAGMFVRACWQTSRDTAGFCDAVPKPFDVFRSARWRTEQSKKAGIDEQFGGQLFGQQQAYCQEKAERAVSPR